MNIEAMPKEVRESLLSRGYSDAEIAALAPEKAFDEYCNWHGLIGWGPRLRTVLDGLRKAKEPS